MRGLERDGILLVHDADLPSATRIVVGERVSGSWWSHPAANEIYDALQPLDNVATRVKLVRQKVTFVHQRLFPDLIAIGLSKERWMTDSLSTNARTALAEAARRRSAVTTAQLLARVDRKERLRVVRESKYASWFTRTRYTPRPAWTRSTCRRGADFNV